MLIALTRPLSPNITDCELTFLPREPISIAEAIGQHRTYVERLRSLGAYIVEARAAPELPDSVFVEDTTIVLDEIAIMARSGALSRRPEVASVAEVLAKYRPLHYLQDPATLDGGDVFRAERTIFIGLSTRTNSTAVEQVRSIAALYGYIVRAVSVTGCLHLKSACTYLGRNTLLVNRALIDSAPLDGYTLIDVPADEPDAADTAMIGDVVLLPASFPQTRQLLEKHGFKVETLDLSELQKAEAGASCMSVIFEDKPV